MKSNQELGRKGENQAEKYLKGLGYNIVERNWRWGKAEIDIIAQIDGFIVFVEVKTRSSEDFGSPYEFVSNKQQRMIIHAAHEYIISKDIDLEARFDIIALVKNGKIEHIEEAFYPM